MSDIVTEGIIPYPGAKLTLWQRRQASKRRWRDVDGERLIGTYAEIIHDQWDPYKISVQQPALSRLCEGRDVVGGRLEREHTTRVGGAAVRVQVAARHASRHRDGAQLFRARFRRSSGYTIQQALRPPQCFFASPSMSKEAYDFWIHLLPEVRITFYEGVGWDGVDVLYSDDGGVNDFVGLDDGEALHGRKAYLRIRGKDIPLQIYTFTKEINGVTSVDFERIAIPGLAGPAYLQGDFVNDEQFVCAETHAAATGHGADRWFLQPRAKPTASRHGAARAGADRCALRARERHRLGQLVLLRR